MQINDQDSEISPSSLQFSINGFRSLRNFEIEIQPGLNIITGRNGSGKTNFIEFLDFLSVFVKDGLQAAVSTQGGTTRIFSQETMRSRNPRLQVRVRGLARLQTGKKVFEIETEIPYFRFDYNLEVRVNKPSATVYVSRESLSFFRLMSDPDAFEEQRVLGRIEISRKFDAESQSILESTKYSPRLTASSHRNPLRFLSRPYSRPRDGMKPSEARQDYLETALSEPDETESFLGAGYPFPAMRAVVKSLSRSRAFNFIPSQIRRPSNITDDPIILPDGSGLSAVLHHMDRAHKRGQSGNYHYMYNFSPESLPKVISWTTLLIPELIDISANADLSTGKYQAQLSIESQNSSSQLKVPFHSASDGTLKWLALACKLAQEPDYFTIEEPENFLHPQMQSFLVQMLREIGEYSGSGPNFIIISTHSETIINNCSPRELILFNFNHQRTSCRRVSNEENLIDEMNKTGFGLGHYYVANAVS